MNYACHIEEIDNSIFNLDKLNSNISNYYNMFNDNLNFPFDKTISQIYENVKNTLIDNESKIFNAINIKKKNYSYESEPQNDNSNLEFNINIGGNPTNQNFVDNIFENISNNFEEELLINFNKIQSILDNKKLFFVPHGNQNNYPLNKNKKQIFAIHKDIKRKNPYFNINNEKKVEKNENDNVCILINDSKEDEKTKINFMVKKEIEIYLELISKFLILENMMIIQKE